ncbi:MAG: FAD-binding oxidoreductase [Woeseiaceae bacterium]|nr:FAD-binding oxidoreductase [Woeseiaceae bacterium]
MNRRHFCMSTLAAAISAAHPRNDLLAAVLNEFITVTADVNAVTGDGAQLTIKRSAVQDFGDSLRGRLLLPGHEAYDDARRVINGSIDKYPALIAQCVGSADVKSAVDFARSEGLLVAVKCGGHSFSGKSTCDGGLMIDLSTMRGVQVDPAAKIAHVRGGSLLGDMDHETMSYGLVTTAGTVSHTGVGGLTTGGGFGRLGRRFGLTIDNLVSVDVITADGQFRHASLEENPDLFWGIRGGGGNFGIVTSFEFRLHPMDRMIVDAFFEYPISQARSVLRNFAEFAVNAPDELNIDGGLRARPGRDNYVGFHAVWSGPKNQTDKVLAPLRKAGTLLREHVEVKDYVVMQREGDNTDPRATGTYLKSGFTKAYTPQLIDTIVDGFDVNPSWSANLGAQQSGGAIGRIAEDATAFAHRYSEHNMLLSVSWPVDSDPTERIAWARAYWAELEPHTFGFYTNDLLQSNVPGYANYRDNLDRLVTLKNKYDPKNLFRLNANIRPTV